VDRKSQHLTRRELEILKLLVSGDSTEQITKLQPAERSLTDHAAE
jgi:DNA-binding CsgD family transcriptional regulator